jgi:hypothetical protein
MPVRTSGCCITTSARELHTPLVETLRTILQRGERKGLFRRGVDPVQRGLFLSSAAIATLLT